MGLSLRQIVRNIVRTPNFSLIAVLCLALGIGATSAMFTIVNSVVLQPLPYREPDRLVRAYTEFPKFPNGGLRRFTTSEPEVFDMKADKAFETVGAWASQGLNITTSTTPIRVTATGISAEGFSTLGVAPELGRLFTAEEDKPKAPGVVVLSHDLWQRSYGGDPHILERDVFLDGEKCKVVGVMPRGFLFPPGEISKTEVWTALQLNPLSTNRGGHNYNVFARLRPGVSIQQARAEMAALVAHWGESFSPMGNNHVFSPENHPIVIYDFYDETVGGVRKAIWLLLGAVVFVLLIACVNVANLLLARSEGRQKEIAVRRAVGASGMQLLAQFVAEGVMLSFAGAAVGVALAYGGLRLILSAGSASIPRAEEVTLDLRVLGFTLVVSILSGIIFGLAPLIHVPAIKLYDTLKASGGRASSSVSSHNFRRALVITETALAFILLAGASLMVRGFWRLQQVNVGFDPQGVLTAQIPLPSNIYKDSKSQQQFCRRLIEECQRIPGVQAAAIASGLPPKRGANENDTGIEGFVASREAPIQSVNFYQTVSPGFFSALGIRVLEGRPLEDRDADPRSLGVVINQSMARTFWPHTTAVGRWIQPGGDTTKYTIVGVVADLKNGGVDRPVGTEIFLPYLSKAGYTGSPYIIVRTTGDSKKLTSAVRSAVSAVDSGVAVAQVRTMEEVIDQSSSRSRFLVLLLAMFSGLALLLAAVGVYGVISYSVAQRTSEFGIKMALGAEPWRLMRYVLGQGVTLTAAGMLVGTAGAVFLTKMLAGLIYGVTGLDWMVMAATAFVLLFATLAACYAPAARAMRIEPIRALRYE
jgi:putative ABC transport system permease protein